MAEGFLARACRVVDAGVDSVVGAAERLAGDGLMRQAIRDVEHARDDLLRQQRRATLREAHATERARAAAERAARLEDEARLALTKGRDDLAQVAVAEKQRAERIAADSLAEAQAAAAEARGHGEAAADLAARHRVLAEELRSHEAMVAKAAAAVPPAVDSRVIRAEHSFARALARAGGGAAAVGAAGELGELSRQQAVADELAALRAGLGGEAAPRAKRKG